MIKHLVSILIYVSKRNQKRKENSIICWYTTIDGLKKILSFNATNAKSVRKEIVYSHSTLTSIYSTAILINSKALSWLICRYIHRNFAKTRYQQTLLQKQAKPNVDGVSCTWTVVKHTKNITSLLQYLIWHVNFKRGLEGRGHFKTIYVSLKKTFLCIKIKKKTHSNFKVKLSGFFLYLNIVYY